MIIKVDLGWKCAHSATIGIVFLGDMPLQGGIIMGVGVGMDAV